MKQMNISIQGIWNSASEQREAKKRDYLYASEIGKSKLDVYYSVMGEPVTNPFDERIQRIFDAGSSFEWLIKRVMDVEGLLKEEEVVCEVPATENTLSVHGRADMLIGGTPKVQENSKEFEHLPDFLKVKVRAISEHLKDTKDIKPFIAEIKSVNSNAFWAHKNLDENGYFKGYEHHKLGQLTTYLIARGEDRGRLFYVSRDDLCLMETEVLRSQWEAKWWEYVKEMTYYIRNQIEPEREPDIVFNEAKTSKFYPKGKYEVNWNIGRSLYLTKITGMKKEDWEDYAGRLVKEENNKIKDTKANRSKNEKLDTEKTGSKSD